APSRDGTLRPVPDDAPAVGVPLDAHCEERILHRLPLVLLSVGKALPTELFRLLQESGQQTRRFSWTTRIERLLGYVHLEKEMLSARLAVELRGRDATDPQDPPPYNFLARRPLDSPKQVRGAYHCARRRDRRNSAKLKLRGASAPPSVPLQCCR